MPHQFDGVTPDKPDTEIAIVRRGLDRGKKIALRQVEAPAARFQHRANAQNRRVAAALAFRNGFERRAQRFEFPALEHRKTAARYHAQHLRDRARLGIKRQCAGIVFPVFQNLRAIAQALLPSGVPAASQFRFQKIPKKIVIAVFVRRGLVQERGLTAEVQQKPRIRAPVPRCRSRHPTPRTPTSQARTAVAAA